MYEELEHLTVEIEEQLHEVKAALLYLDKKYDIKLNVPLGGFPVCRIEEFFKASLHALGEKGLCRFIDQFVVVEMRVRLSDPPSISLELSVLQTATNSKIAANCLKALAVKSWAARKMADDILFGSLGNEFIETKKKSRFPQKSLIKIAQKKLVTFRK